MKLYEITFSFFEPVNAVGTFAAESEEQAKEKLFNAAGDYVKELDIISIEYKGDVDDQTMIAAPASGTPINTLLN